MGSGWSHERLNTDTSRGEWLPSKRRHSMRGNRGRMLQSQQHKRRSWGRKEHGASEDRARRVSLQPGKPGGEMVCWDQRDGQRPSLTGPCRSYKELKIGPKLTIILIMNAAINRTALSKTWGSPNSGILQPPSPCCFSTSSAGPPDGEKSAKPVSVDSYKKPAEAPGAR